MMWAFTFGILDITEKKVWRFIRLFFVTFLKMVKDCNLKERSIDVFYFRERSGHSIRLNVEL